MKKIKLESFFQKNQKQLQSLYPGLKLKRLQEDFENFIGDESLFCEKLLTGEPLEYITGQSFFYKNSFRVTPDVLIPRSETEILVEKALEVSQKIGKVIELGVGSGAVLCSYLLECPYPIKAYATHISEAALNVAKENFKRKGLEVVCFLADRLIDVEEKFDLILFNPPYIMEEKDKNGVHPQVLKFEPKEALFLKDEVYLDWFDELFSQVAQCLNPSGTFLMEGHEDHLKDLSKLIRTKDFKSCEIFQDYTNRDRFLKLTK